MKGNETVVQLLNEILAAELAALTQYFLDSKTCENWGYDRLARHFREDSMGEMRDAEELMDRILYLEGSPRVEPWHIRVGATAPEKLALALELEREAITRLNRGIGVCTEKGDQGTRELLASILKGEEGHASWLESQLGLIASLGEANYLSQQIRD